MGAQAERMIDVLAAPGPCPAHVDQLMLYGRFIGAWEGSVTVYRRDGTRREESCEVSFGWVLDGRAVQDVWIAPARKDRGGEGSPGDIYGTTIRVYSPESDSWDITWIEPHTGAHGRMVGRQVGADIVQEYRDEEGTLWQWRFTGITADAFLWQAHESADDGATWQLRNEFRLRRRVGGSPRGVPTDPGRVPGEE